MKFFFLVYTKRSNVTKFQHVFVKRLRNTLKKLLDSRTKWFANTTQTFFDKRSFQKLETCEIQFTQPLNEDYKQKKFVFWENMKQVINDDSINGKEEFFLTKLIFIYMGTLTNNITDFGHTRILRNWNQGIKT